MTVGGGDQAVQWSYTIVKPDGSRGGTTVGFRSAGHAERSFRLHLSQYATDYHDDGSVLAAWSFLLPDQRDDHLLDAAWQRARTAAEHADCADKHQWAGDLAAEYLPPLLAAAEAHARAHG